MRVCVCIHVCACLCVLRAFACVLPMFVFVGLLCVLCAILCVFCASNSSTVQASPSWGFGQWLGFGFEPLVLVEGKWELPFTKPPMGGKQPS